MSVTFPEARALVESFGHSFLEALSKKYKIPEPGLRIGLIGTSVVVGATIRLSAYYSSLKTIALSTLWVDFRRVDKEKTEEALRFSIAHEFCHYLRDCQNLLPIAWKVRPPVRDEEEGLTDEFAFKETGTDRARQNYLIFLLLEEARPLIPFRVQSLRVKAYKPSP